MQQAAAGCRQALRSARCVTPAEVAGGQGLWMYRVRLGSSWLVISPADWAPIINLACHPQAVFFYLGPPSHVLYHIKIPLSVNMAIAILITVNTVGLLRCVWAL